MKSIVLILLIIGIMFISLGYQRYIIEQTLNPKTIIEYRYLPPPTQYETVFNKSDQVTGTLADMFTNNDLVLQNASKKA